MSGVFDVAGQAGDVSLQPGVTSLDRLSVGPFTHDTMGHPGGFVNVLWILGSRWN